VQKKPAPAETASDAHLVKSQPGQKAEKKTKMVKMVIPLLLFLQM